MGSPSANGLHLAHKRCVSQFCSAVLTKGCHLGAASIILQYLPCSRCLHVVCQQQARRIDIQRLKPFLRESTRARMRR